MARKMKIIIQTTDTNVNLPAVPLGVCYTFIKLGLWSSQFFKDMDEDSRIFLEQNKDMIVKVAKEIIKQLKEMEPFVLVEVVDEEQHILIEMR